MKGNGLARRWSTYAYSAGYDAKARAASRTRPAEVMESTCGRPLGLRFHYESGNLYITDAYKELMRVGPADDETTVLANKADAMPLRFTNGVDKSPGEVFFTDSSMNYQRSRHERVTAIGDSTSHLMKDDPKTNNVTVLQSGITYPNCLVISAYQIHFVIAPVRAS